jgi:DNA repair protein RadD
MQLRPYQQTAVDAIIKDISRDGNSIVTLPTGAGKSLVIGRAVGDLNTHALILCPNREILSQNLEKLGKYVHQDDVGIYSASFNSRDIGKFTLATIQSVYTKPHLFMGIKIVFVDECHLVNVRDVQTMYKKFFTAIGKPKVIGLTATPYRIDTAYEKVPSQWGEGYDLISHTVLKMITRMKDKKDGQYFWHRIVANISHQELVDGGYLMPITYIQNPLIDYKEIPVNRQKTDFDMDAFSDMIIGQEANAVNLILDCMTKHKSTLVFCASVEQAYRLSDVITGSKVVEGKTPASARAEIITQFKKGEVKAVLNVGVLTTGFDHPELDAIVLIRPTRSPLLYNQMIGRLTRVHPNKTSATVYDLTGTVKEMGRVETFKMFQVKPGLWDLATEEHPRNHGRILYSMKIQQ